LLQAQQHSDEKVGSHGPVRRQHLYCEATLRACELHTDETDGAAIHEGDNGRKSKIAGLAQAAFIFKQ
jgi:hypothetical protein